MNIMVSTLHKNTSSKLGVIKSSRYGSFQHRHHMVLSNSLLLLKGANNFLQICKMIRHRTTKFGQYRSKYQRHSKQPTAAHFSRVTGMRGNRMRFPQMTVIHAIYKQKLCLFLFFIFLFLAFFLHHMKIICNNHAF